MAINMKKKGRASDVRILFFGPSEEMIAKGGEDVDGMLKEASDLGMYKTACVFIAQQHKIDQTLTAKGVKLEPAGEVLAIPTTSVNFTGEYVEPLFWNKMF